MERQHQMTMSWRRFATMIAVSTVIMFFMMYHLVYSADHAMFSLNRLLASLVMGAIMTVVMLAFMWKMYTGHALKLAVLVVSTLIAVALLATNRTQALVGDTGFMKAMIPHHSIAINNARKARISDPRVRKLADKIIRSQVEEIALMKALIRDIDRNGARGERPLPAVDAKVKQDMLPRIEKAVQ